MGTLNFQSIKHLFEIDNKGNVIFNSNRFRLNQRNVNLSSNIIEPIKIELINKNIICKETKQIRKPLDSLCNEIINQVDSQGDEISLRKLAYIFNISALMMTYRGHYQDAYRLCKSQIASIRKITGCSGYDQPCTYYYQPLINMARLDLLQEKTYNSLKKFKKLFKVYLSYIFGALPLRLEIAFLKDNEMINVIAGASLQGLFKCLIKLSRYEEILQYDRNLSSSAMITNLINECCIIAYLCLGKADAAINWIEKNKGEFNPNNINAVFFREAQYYFLTSDSQKSLSILEKLARDSKERFKETFDAYYLFFINQIAMQVKNMGNEYLFTHLIDYLIERYEEINDEVGLISCLIEARKVKALSDNRNQLLISHLKRTAYACFNVFKSQMGISVCNHQISMLENKLLERLNLFSNRGMKYAG